MLAAQPLGLGQVGRKQLFVHQAGVVTEFPGPVGRVPREWIQGDVTASYIECAAVLRLLCLAQCPERDASQQRTSSEGERYADAGYN